jgi:acyl transferase domain-containing protein
VSPLTKLFVVLLVVLALLTTSATVVFVTQTQDYQRDASAAKEKLGGAQNELQQLQAAASAERENAQRAIRETQAQLEQMRQAANQVQTRVNELAAANGVLNSEKAMMSADLTRVTAALTAAQDQNAKQAETIAQLRTTNDERLEQNVELNTAVTELTDKLQVTERERRFLSEQLTEAKTTVDKQGAMLREAGINPVMARAGTPAGAPPINGVIRARRDIAGIPYATISVGSNDGVVRGMRFNIVNRQTGDFLGILTVDSVEQTESTGRLEGPRLNDVRAGVDVKTQL